METTLVRLIDYKAKCRAKSSLFNFPNKSYITASNITRFDPCNIRKILKIGAHDWNIMSENVVRRIEEVAGQSVRQLKILISKHESKYKVIQSVTKASLTQNYFIFRRALDRRKCHKVSTFVTADRNHCSIICEHAGGRRVQMMV